VGFAARGFARLSRRLAAPSTASAVFPSKHAFVRVLILLAPGYHLVLMLKAKS